MFIDATISASTTAESNGNRLCCFAALALKEKPRRKPAQQAVKPTELNQWMASGSIKIVDGGQRQVRRVPLFPFDGEQP
jgi:hypothetical protein